MPTAAGKPKVGETWKHKSGTTVKILERGTGEIYGIKYKVLEGENKGRVGRQVDFSYYHGKGHWKHVPDK